LEWAFVATRGPRDYYEVLGVSRGASDDDIRTAYRNLARKHHPDVSDDPSSAETFTEISDAYAVLSDPEKRSAYDRFGHAGASAGPAGHHHAAGGSPFQGAAGGADFSDLFEQMFGGSGSPFGEQGPRSRARPTRGADATRAITVSFMTAVRGGTEVLHVGTDGGSERIEVKIPAGLEDGAKLRVKGRGGSSHTGGEAGDLIVTVSIGAHPLFRREGLDLLVDLPITLAEAALGTTVTAPLISGTVDLKVPAGASSGQKLRVPGQGIETAAGKKGNYYAVIQIIAPRALSERGRQLVEELAGELQNPRDSGPWTDMR
jgi:DnaJ-class molecular chaperone